jgi:hypothetical protein
MAGPLPLSREKGHRCGHAKTCEEKNLKSSRFCHIFSDQINIKRRHPMFSGLILGLGLGIVGLIVYFLHKEHGPAKHH